MADDLSCDLAIVGGGLAGGLIALALAKARPDVDVRIVEPGPIGGNHIWSFFDADVVPADRALLDPLIAHRWTGYDVAFPAHRRTLRGGYNSIESERFGRIVRERVGEAGIVAAEATGIGPTHVALADGRRIAARGVIDARGAGDISALELGWQKFVGRSLEFEAPHRLARPIVMDATVDQSEGYRFVYCLPFGPRTLFVEDTYYGETPDLDAEEIGARIEAYAEQMNWKIAGAGRAESGALPVVIGGDFDAYWNGSGAGVAKAGVRAGLFHPTTGYSLPDAVTTAQLVARLGDLSGAFLHKALYDHARKTWDARGFYRMLGRMLFRAADPPRRYRIFERFYRLDPGLIERFYAGRSTAMDKLRIVSGKPPVPIGRALLALMGRGS